jgi:hypothetical protein
VRVLAVSWASGQPRLSCCVICAHVETAKTQDPKHKRKQNHRSEISRIALTWPLFYECSVSRIQLPCQNRDGRRSKLLRRMRSRSIHMTDLMMFDLNGSRCCLSDVLVSINGLSHCVHSHANAPSKKEFSCKTRLLHRLQQRKSRDRRCLLTRGVESKVHKPSAASFGEFEGGERLRHELPFRLQITDS